MKFKNLLKGAILTTAFTASQAMAGNIYLTGHDTLLHGGQAGYDDVILGYLADGRDQTMMDITVIGSGVGSWNFTGTDFHTKTGYNSTTYYDTDVMTAADWTSALSNDVFIYLSHTSCGGCDVSSAGVIAVNAQSAAIATAFNAGMDIWANSGASNSDYYNFLPAGVAAAGTSIGGSSGFTATAAGTAIGIVSSNINGYPTHNRFSSFAPAFTIFEERGTESISLGLLDGTITGGGITTGRIPEPATLALLGLGLLGLSARRFKKSA